MMTQYLIQDVIRQLLDGLKHPIKSIFKTTVQLYPRRVRLTEHRNEEYKGVKILIIRGGQVDYSVDAAKQVLVNEVKNLILCSRILISKKQKVNMISRQTC